MMRPGKYSLLIGNQIMVPFVISIRVNFFDFYKNYGKEVFKFHTASVDQYL